MIATEVIVVLSHANHCDLAVTEVGGAYIWQRPCCSLLLSGAPAPKKLAKVELADYVNGQVCSFRKNAVSRFG